MSGQLEEVKQATFISKKETLNINEATLVVERKQKINQELRKRRSEKLKSCLIVTYCVPQIDFWDSKNEQCHTMFTTQTRAKPR